MRISDWSSDVCSSDLKDGVPFAKYMSDNGMIPGIKVDKGTHALAGFPGKVVTEGLDGLRARLEEYYKLGARFAKWRAVINIGDDIPSGTCIEANAHALDRKSTRLNSSHSCAYRMP